MPRFMAKKKKKNQIVNFLGVFNSAVWWSNSRQCLNNTINTKVGEFIFKEMNIANIAAVKPLEFCSLLVGEQEAAAHPANVRMVL